MVFDPTTITGLISRWKASDLSGTLSDTDPVDSWVDSINSINCTGSSVATFDASVASLNDQPGVTFAGSGVLAATTGIPSGYFNAFSAATCFSVVRLLTQPSTVQGLFNATSGTATTSARFRPQIDASHYASLTTRRLDADAATTLTGAAAVVANNTSYVLTHRMDWANNDAWVYVNGTQQLVSTSQGTAGTTSATDSLAVFLGSNSTGTQTLVGIISEILVYDSALGDSDRANVHSYIQDTYGITVSDYVASAVTPAPFSALAAIPGVTVETPGTYGVTTDSTVSMTLA